MMCPLGIAVALVRRSARAVPAGPAGRGDVPERLLRWAAACCPPSGPSGARRCSASWTTSTAGAGGGASRPAARAPRCCWRPGGGPPRRCGRWSWPRPAPPACTPPWPSGTGWVPVDWVWAAIVLVFLVSFTLAAATLLRRPQGGPARAAGRPVGRPGLAGGVRVHLLRGHRPDNRKWSPLIAEVAVPVLGGRPAPCGAAAPSPAGAPPGWPPSAPAWACTCTRPSRSRCSAPADRQGTANSTVSDIVSDRLGNNVIADLVVVPLMTATIGWAAAAATARLGPRMAVSMVSVPLTAAGPVGEGSRNPMTSPHEAGQAVRVRSWHRTAYLLLLCAVVAAALVLAAASWLRG